MSKLYLGLCSICLLALAGCNVSNRELNIDMFMEGKNIDSKHQSKPEFETKTLKFWWAYFNDQILDSLVRSSVNFHDGKTYKLNDEGVNKDIESPAAKITDEKAKRAENIVRLYIQYRSVQGKIAAIDMLSVERNFLARELGAHHSSEESRLKTEIENEIIKLTNIKALSGTELDKISKDIAAQSGLLKEYISEILKGFAPMPHSDIIPVLGTSAKAFTVAPIMRAHALDYNDGADRLDSVFPNKMIGDVFGVSGDAYSDQNASWNLKAGTFAQQINLSALPQDKQGQKFQDNIASSLFAFQGKLIRYSELDTQYKTLKKAYINSADDYELLKDKYIANGDFVTSLMDKQKDLYDLQLAVMKAQNEQLRTLVDIYTYFGVY